MTTTSKIYPREIEWMQHCMKVTGIKPLAKFLEKLHDEVILRQQKEFYNKLPQEGEKKPLRGKRIPKNTSLFR